MAAPARKRPRISPPPGDPAPATAQSHASLSEPSSIPTPPCATHAVPLPSHYLAASGPLPAFQQPVHLASFSYSPNRTLLLDDTHKDDALAYYHPPPLGCDLNYGFEQVVWRDGTVDEGLDALLDSYVAVPPPSHPAPSADKPARTDLAASLSVWASKQPQPAADDLLGKTAVITWRGIMTKLMLAVYEVDSVASGRRGDGWEMNAMVVDGCLYLEESNPPAKLAAKVASESSNALPSYYGYSFESFCTAAPSSSSSSSLSLSDFAVPNTNVQWCSVVKTNLGGFRTLVGGEVDCVRAGTDPARITPADFIELKTNLVIQSQREEVNFERQKLLKHYVQSFLLGVPTITVGFRTRQGQLAAIQSFHTLEIPRLVRGKPHAWTPAACLACARDLLAFVSETVRSHGATRRAETRLRQGAVPGGGSEGAPAREAPETSSASWPVFRVSFSPQQDGTVTVRELTAVEVEEQVLRAKRPLVLEGSRPGGGGPGRIGFLPARWVHEVRERRARLEKVEQAAVPDLASLKPKASANTAATTTTTTIGAPVAGPASSRRPGPPPPPPPPPSSGRIDDITTGSDPTAAPPAPPPPHDGGALSLLRRDAPPPPASSALLAQLKR